MRKTERMSDTSFTVMNLIFQAMDLFFPYIDRQVKSFGIQAGMTVVDYGCGPGRYTERFVKLVGETGQVYAVDIHEMAIETIQRKMVKYQWRNVAPLLAKGYNSGVPDRVADVVCALDMFFIIQHPAEFLAELGRIAKPDGVLIIDDGHQSRQATKQKLGASRAWGIVEETGDHLKCKLVP